MPAAGHRDKLLAQITLSEVAGHEARDFGWLVRALQLLRAARQVRACQGELGNALPLACDQLLRSCVIPCRNCPGPEVACGMRCMALVTLSSGHRSCCMCVCCMVAGLWICKGTLTGVCRCCMCVPLQLLGNSYAFAYYFFGPMYSSEFSPEELKILQDLFEDNQDMLAQEVRQGGVHKQPAPGLRDKNVGAGARAGGCSVVHQELGCHAAADVQGLVGQLHSPVCSRTK
jgi:hypothetical protein